MTAEVREERDRVEGSAGPKKSKKEEQEILLFYLEN